MSRGAGACKKCRSTDTTVTQTRHSGGKTTRKHLCRSCNNRWTTVQEAATYVGWVRVNA